MPQASKLQTAEGARCRNGPDFGSCQLRLPPGGRARSSEPSTSGSIAPTHHPGPRVRRDRRQANSLIHQAATELHALGHRRWRGHSPEGCRGVLPAEEAAVPNPKPARTRQLCYLAWFRGEPSSLSFPRHPCVEGKYLEQGVEVRVRLLGITLAAFILVTFGSVAMPTPAGAAESNTQTRMQEFSAGEIWTTSGTWGRVRHRTGFEWTLSAPYQVRAVAQFQVDWPTGCTVGISKDGPALDGCDPKLGTKRLRLEFHEIVIPLQWTGPDGSGSLTCRFQDTGTEPSDFSETWTCTGDWIRQQDDFQYTVSTSTLNADVDDDGEGLKDLAPISSTLTFVQQ